MTRASAACRGCADHPVARCGRCAAPLCRAHLPACGHRCAGCEREYRDDGGARRALQHMFAPPAFVLGGGLTFAALIPVLLALPFVAAATVVASLAMGAGFGSAHGTCRLIDRAARAQFLREHARGLPAARARIVRRPRLPSPRPLR